MNYFSHELLMTVSIWALTGGAALALFALVVSIIGTLTGKGEDK